MNYDIVDVAKNKLNKFREYVKLLGNPSSTDLYLLQQFGYSVQFNNAQKIALLNRFNSHLTELERQEQWEALNLTLDFYNQHRYEAFTLICHLTITSRWEEISKIANLIGKNEWHEIDRAIHLFYIKGLDAVTSYLSKIDKTTEPPNLFDMDRTDERIDTLIKYTAVAGLTEDQARNVNEKHAESLIKIDEERTKKIDAAQIEISKKRAENDEILRMAEEQKKRGVTVAIGSKSNEVDIEPNYQELEQNFIRDNHLIRIETNKDSEIYIWEEKNNKYKFIDSKKSLANRFNSYIYKQYNGKVEVSSTQIDASVNRMYGFSIPTLENMLKEKNIFINEYLVFFRNGYYDLSEGKFNQMDSRKFFHTFSLPYDYDEQAEEPKIFNEMLKQIFDDDESSIRLVYQIIGAIISNVPLKNIFIFQGASHGGKSTISNCITYLLDYTDFKVLISINEINENKINSYKSKKLLYIDDATEEWKKNTVSYLKGWTSGIDWGNKDTFKILISTNHPVQCDNKRDMEALNNRIVCLQFKKDMRKYAEANLSEVNESIKNLIDNHFVTERQQIVKKALESFQEVLNNDKNFSSPYSLNIENISSKINILIGCETNKKATSSDRRKTMSAKNIELVNWLKATFEQTDDENEFMMAEEVYEQIKNQYSDTNGRTEDAGKAIKEAFGDKCKWERRPGNKRFYKIKLKNESLRESDNSDDEVIEPDY